MSTIGTIVSSAVRREIGPHSLKKGHGLKSVVVLGAGASKPFGLPLAAELLGDLVRWKSAGNGHPSLKSLFDFIDYFYPGMSRSAGRLPDAEDLLGMIDVARAYCDIRSRGRGNRWRTGRLDEVASALLRTLSGFLWSFQDTIPRAKLKPLEDFVSSRGESTIYITFNYDLLLESALSATRIPFAYGLNMPPNGVSIIKPHGSLNWFGPSVRLPNGVDAYSLGGDISAVMTLTPSAIPFPKWRESILIPPTPSKQIAARDLRSMWTCFASAIHATERLLIVGYSLPSADRLARLILRKAGPIHHVNRKITVVNPDDDGLVAPVYTKHVSPGCTFVRQRFEDWAASGFAH